MPPKRKVPQKQAVQPKLGSMQDGPQRMTTRSRNKDVHPAIAAGATPKPRAPRGSAQQAKLHKAASKAAQQAALEEKEELDTQHIATIEEESTAAYANTVTPRPPPALKSKPENHKGDDRAQEPPLRPPSPMTDLESEPSRSSDNYLPSAVSNNGGSDNDEEEDLTDDISDINATVKKRPVKKKRSFRAAIEAFQQTNPAKAQEDCGFVTPKAVPLLKRARAPGVAVSG